MVARDVRRDAYQMGLSGYDLERLARAMDARNEFGRQKYGIGIGLQVENGRDPLKDASGVLPTLTGLVSGTAYRITTILADGSEGTWKYTAA